MKKALVIGIDAYQGQRALQCCVNDATEVGKLLHRNEDKKVNFEVQMLTSRTANITNELLADTISRFFKSGTNVDTAVLYFAGHGVISPQTDAGYILGIDACKGNWGVPLSELLGLANDAHDHIHSSVIILDCCHAGAAGEVAGMKSSAAFIGPGVTILTSCNEDEKAIEGIEHGIFTELLLDGLRGGCADIRGNVTPASLYAHIDQTLGVAAQRPLYKANVQQFVTLRQVAPKIPLEMLLNLPTYFPDPDMVYPLDPSYEPDRKSVSEEFKNLPVNDEHVVIFKQFQKCNRQGLIDPVGVEHMFDAAMKSTGCRLTPIGKHYRRLAQLGKL